MKRYTVEDLRNIMQAFNYMRSSSQRVVLNFFLGKRKAAVTPAFLNVFSRVNMKNLAEYNIKFDLLDTMYKSSRRDNQDYLVDTIKPLVQESLKEIKDEYFDNSVFNLVRKQEFETLTKEDFEYYKQNILMLEDTFFEIN